LFGLLLSGGAILQATGAKRAAEAARQAVFSRNATEDVGRLREIATSLLLAIETEQYGLANYRARDFISDARESVSAIKPGLARTEVNWSRPSVWFGCFQFDYRREKRRTFFSKAHKGCW